MTQNKTFRPAPKRSSWLWLSIAVLLAFTASGMLAPLAASAAPADDPGAVVEAWVEALNKRDTEAAIALYADDAVIDLFGKELAGKEAIARRQKSTIGPTLQPELVIQDLKVEGETVTLTLRGENSITRFDNHGPITNQIVFTIRDGLIVREVGPVLSPADMAWYADAQQRFQQAGAKPVSLPNAGEPGVDSSWLLLGLALVGGVLVAGGATLRGRRAHQDNA